MDLKPSPIGRGMKTGGSLFSRAPFSNSSKPVLSGPSLGETEQARYVRAKAAVSKYDDLADRLQKISDKTYRDQVALRVHGDSVDLSAPVNIRNSVFGSVTEAESYMPVNYMVFTSQKANDAIASLEDLDRTFEEAVTTGEKTYGKGSQAPGSPAPLSGPSLGMDTSSVICGAAGLVILGTIVYFAVK